MKHVRRCLVAALVVYVASVAVLAWWLPPEPVARVAREASDCTCELRMPEGQLMIERQSPEGRRSGVLDFATGEFRPEFGSQAGFFADWSTLAKKCAPEGIGAAGFSQCRRLCAAVVSRPERLLVFRSDSRERIVRIPSAIRLRPAFSDGVEWQIPKTIQTAHGVTLSVYADDGGVIVSDSAYRSFAAVWHKWWEAECLTAFKFLYRRLACNLRVFPRGSTTPSLELPGRQLATGSSSREYIVAIPSSWDRFEIYRRFPDPHGAKLL